MAAIGKVTAKKFEFEWRIENFLKLSIKDRERYDSPLFSFAGESWFLSLYPNGQSEYNTVGSIAIYLSRKKSGRPVSLTVSLSLKTFDGKKDEKFKIQFTHLFKKVKGYGARALVSRSTLSEKKLELLPSDTLTAVCTIKYSLKATDDDDDDGGGGGGGDKNEPVKCSHCKGSFVPSPEQKCPDKAVICPTYADVVGNRKCSDHECEKVRVKATETLIDDLGNIFCNEEHSDVTIKVKEEEFRLHRCILAGRNPYFHSMFKTEMKEKATGIITIDDCEPGIFRSFISFLYAGKTDDLSPENVCDLYKVADKCQADQLKEECLCFMNNKMSVETFCDFIVLALKHDEKELLQNATDLFCRKIKEIIQSVKWQNFLRDYPTEANELHIKALDHYVK